jgi:hypothetical protein
VAVEPVTPPPPRPRTLQPPPPGWRVPHWLTTPVSSVAIPDSPFGWGHHPAATASSSPPAAALESEPATVGFAEPEDTPAEEKAPGAATETASTQTPAEPSIAASAADVAAAPDAEPTAAASADAASASGSDILDTPIQAATAAPIEEPSAPAPDPEVKPSPAAVDALTEPAPAVVVGDEKRAAGFPAEPSPSEAADEGPVSGAAGSPPPGNAGELRPWARQMRAPRPLGAPQAAARAEAASGTATEGVGLPAADLPALIEPEIDPLASTETAVMPRPEDRPAERSTMRNRRLYRRVSIDAGFEIDGASAQLLDISMGGFAAAKAPPLAPERVVATVLRLSVDGVDISTRIRARMIYCDELRSGGRFIDLTASQTALLRYLVTWRGQSVGALGTTTLLDAITRWPEQGLPSAPALPPVERERRPPLWTRFLGWWRGRRDPDQ